MVSSKFILNHPFWMIRELPTFRVRNTERSGSNDFRSAASLQVEAQNAPHNSWRLL